MVSLTSFLLPFSPSLPRSSTPFFLDLTLGSLLVLLFEQLTATTRNQHHHSLYKMIRNNPVCCARFARSTTRPEILDWLDFSFSATDLCVRSRTSGSPSLSVSLVRSFLVSLSFVQFSSSKEDENEKDNSRNASFPFIRSFVHSFYPSFFF